MFVNEGGTAMVNWLKKRCTDKLLSVLLFSYMLLQPLLDVLSYWLDATGTGNALTTLLRFGLLAMIMAVGFLLSDRKRYYFALAAVLLLLTAGHVWACRQAGYGQPMVDLANMLRIYQLPMMTLAFITCFKRSRQSMDAVRKSFLWCMGIILIVEVLSVATGTNPYTYPNKSVGILGWFYFANSQSAILSMIVPVALGWALEGYREKPWIVVLASVAGFGMLYGLATRLSYAALVGTGLALTVSLIMVGRLHGWKVRTSALILVICTVAALAGYGVSPMSENNRLVGENRLLKMADIEEKIAADEAAALEAGLTGTELQEARLLSAYEEYLPGVTGYFGISRTAALYDYSENVDVIADMRLQRLNFNQMLMDDSPRSAFWFGLEREDIMHDGVTYDVENDFHGIFYLCGAVGLGLMVLFLGVILVRVLLALVRDFKGVFTMEAAACGTALICCLAHAYFTAGVLRRPNATTYMAVLLAMAWVLTETKRTETN